MEPSEKPILIYIVDDEASICKMVEVGLKDEGMDVRTFVDSPTFLKAIRQQLPDLAIVDWMMPPPDGLEICRLLRSNPDTKHLPIIMLTARGDETDRVLGLEIGADDYVSKPFSLRELAARIRAILRRDRILEEKEHTALTIAGITIDPARRRVKRDGEEIDLTQKEFDLLYTLMREKGRVLTREQLLKRVWQTNYLGDTRTVDVHIRYLRQKIEYEPSNPQYILTVRGVGYSFCEDEDSEKVEEEEGN